MPRLRSDIWVSAYLRQCQSAGLSAVLVKRGAAEAGSILIRLDCLDERVALFGLAPQTAWEEKEREGVDRLWTRLHKTLWMTPQEAHQRLEKEKAFDPDLWIIDVEDRQGRSLLEMMRSDVPSK